MPDIEIDASRLTVPSFTVPEAGTGPIDGSATPPPTVTLPAPGTYHLKQASAPVCDVAFSVSADGTLDFDTALDAIAEGRGTRRLTLHGLPVHLDATALDHDLSLQIGGPALTADRPHDLVLLPCREYLLGGGRGTLAFTLPVSGSVALDPQTSGFASASGTALTVRGHTIRIDATALSHNVEPTSLPRVSFLPRARVNELTVLPADGFSFYVGSSFLADLKFDVGRDGQVSVAPECAGFATAAGDTLVLRGRTIRIDGTALSHDVEPTGAQMSFLPRASVNELTLLPAKGYGFYAGSSFLADLKFDVGRDGQVSVAPECAGFATAAGDTLVLRGRTIRIDGTALSHDVEPTGAQMSFLPRASVNELTLLPAKGYGFYAGSGSLADLKFDVGRDGQVMVAPEFAGCASAAGDTLVLRGCRIRIDGTALSHDVLPWGLARPNIFLPRTSVNELTVLPAKEYDFFSGPGYLADLQFGVGRDGQVTLKPEFAGCASATGDTLVLTGCRIRIDGTALSHDVLPWGLARPNIFLPRTSVNELTVLPAKEYDFFSGPGYLADLQFGVGRDGQVTLKPEFAGCASATGDTLVLTGCRIRIDGTALSHDVLPWGLARPNVFLPRTSVNELTVLPAKEYDFFSGPGYLADLQFGVGRDGQVTLKPEFAGCASATGDTLVLTGCRIRIDGTALSHDLLPLGIARTDGFLPRASVNELTLLPADGYGFQPGSGVVADLKYGVDLDGHVYVDFEFAGVASAVDDTLVLHGHPVLIDATAADSDLVGLSNISASTPGPPPNRRSPREILYVLLPARGYRPQTANGVLRTGFDFERDGTVTFPYSAAGRYSIASPTAPTPSEQGQEVTLNALVRPTDADAGPPRGTVTFTLQQGPPLGTTEVDDQGRASITTSDLPLGDSVIAVDYAGGDAFVAASTTVPHHVNPRQGEPVGDAPLAEVLDWALLPTIALMADPHAVDGHVKLAQSLLNAAGAAAPALVVDGNFGVLTQAAVHTFRAGPILTPGDDIDTPVWFALAVAAPFPLLETGPRIPPMTGPPVAVVQRLLNQQGAEPPLDDDGKYGPETETAVRAFQTAHGLTVTGTVTPETWVALAGPPPTPTPSGLPGSRSMRLTFSYDSADWAQGGPVVRFVSREDLEMTAPLAADPDDSPHGRAGFWYELRDAAGRVLYRRGRHRPIAVLREVPGPEDDGGLVALPLDAPRGTFELIAPLLPEGASVVLFSSPPDPDRLDEPASEIFSLPVD